MVSSSEVSKSDRQGLTPEDLGPRLRECGAQELLAVLEEHLDELTPAHVRQALRNPFASSEVVTLVMKARRLLSVYEVRRELARHPQTPEIHAIRLVGGLYWRDLAKVIIDLKVRPRIRRSAEIQLTNRLPSLALGERVSLARVAGPGVIQELRKDQSPRVIQALLENPRITEGQVLPLASSPATAAEVLELLSKNRRWGNLYSVRSALSRNRRTPVQTALHLLPGLKKIDLKAVASDRSLPKPVRDRAGLLLGRDPT